MRDLNSEHEKTQSIFRLHLNGVKADHGLADKDLARHMGFSISQESYVNKLRNREARAEIHTCDIVTLSQNIVNEFEDHRFLQEMVPDDRIVFSVKSGDTNGCYKDELENITYLCGKIIEQSREKFPDKNKIMDYAHKIAKESATIKQEVHTNGEPV